MRIRKATPEDCLELSRLRKSTIRSINKHDYTPKQIRYWSKRGGVDVFRKSHSERIRYVAIEDEIIVGFVDIEKQNPSELGGLYVHKEFVRRGVGSQLMEKMEDVVRNKGVKQFALRSSITAKPFYESMGYTVVKRIVNRKKGDEFLMKKELL